MTLFVVVILAIWFVASCIAQLPFGLARRIVAIDVAAIIPRWTFFAPTPGTSDYRVIFRDRVKPSDAWRPWRELPLYTTHTGLRCLWNPGKLHIKIISDVVPLLLREASVAVDEPRAMLLTWPYLAVLQYVVAQPADGGRIRQFAVIDSRGCDPPRHLTFLYLSHEHEL